jgi:hypothetical protein
MGTGKSSVLAELARRGYRTVDTDEDGRSEYSQQYGQLWREDRINALIDSHAEGALFLSGTADNQGKFYASAQLSRPRAAPEIHLKTCLICYSPPMKTNDCSYCFAVV